jgi:hypothetical protein
MRTIKTMIVVAYSLSLDPSRAGTAVVALLHSRIISE